MFIFHQCLGLGNPSARLLPTMVWNIACHYIFYSIDLDNKMNILYAQMWIHIHNYMQIFFVFLEKTWSCIWLPTSIVVSPPQSMPWFLVKHYGLNPCANVKFFPLLPLQLLLPFPWIESFDSSKARKPSSQLLQLCTKVFLEREVKRESHPLPYLILLRYI